MAGARERRRHRSESVTCDIDANPSACAQGKTVDATRLFSTCIMCSPRTRRRHGFPPECAGQTLRQFIIATAPCEGQQGQARSSSITQCGRRSANARALRHVAGRANGALPTTTADHALVSTCDDENRRIRARRHTKTHGAPTQRSTYIQMEKPYDCDAYTRFLDKSVKMPPINPPKLY